jgi:hypothetical protein
MEKRLKLVTLLILWALHEEARQEKDSVQASCGLTPNRKEVTTMMYAKPELVPLSDARVAILSGDSDGTEKDTQIQDNSMPPLTHDSVAAYEADE